MPRDRADRRLAHRLVAAVLVLVVLGAFWTLVGTVAAPQATVDHGSRAVQVERPAGSQDTEQYRSGALRAGPRITVRTDLDRLASRLLATWAAAAVLVLAGSWWVRSGRLELVRTSVVPGAALRLRGPPCV